MDYSAEILKYLGQFKTPCVVLLAPNAPPVTRTGKGVEVALNIVLDSSGVADTLSALRAHIASGEGPRLTDAGTFSFGVTDGGRIRVSYATQRGSKIVSVAKVPFFIPTLESICDDRATTARLSELVSRSPMGILAVTGPSSLANSLLVYAVLQQVNNTTRKIIYALERHLTFLMAHAESIVVQSEISGDVRSMEEGVQNAFLFEPDILFVGAVSPSDDIPALAHAVGSGIYTIISSVCLDGDAVIETFAPVVGRGGTAAGRFSRGQVLVTPAGDGSRLDLKFVDMTGRDGQP